MRPRISFGFLERIPKLPPRYRRILRWVGYPLAYIAAFLFFCYVTFPYDRLKQRIVAGYNADQKGPTASHMEIESLEWSWRFPGIRAQGIRLVGPATSEPPAALGLTPKAAPDAAEDGAEGQGDKEDADAAEKADEESKGRHEGRSVITVDDVYARISPLSYLFGTTALSFGGDAFGGSIAGAYSQSSQSLELHLEMDEVEPSQLPELETTVGLPLSGSLTARVDLRLPEGKASKAEGEIDLSIEDFRVGDGKAKIRNTLALPQLDVGVLTLKATVTAGQAQIDTLTADGVDVRLDAGGKIKLRDALLTSIVDLTLSFRFTDKYKTKNEITKSLFGEPGSKAPGLFDLDPQIKRAKGTEGDYTWRISGPVNRLRFTPAKGARITKGGATTRDAIPETATKTARPKVKRPPKKERIKPPKPAAAPPAAPIAPASPAAAPPPAPAAPTPPPPRSQARAAAARRPTPSAAADDAEEEEESEAEEEEEEESAAGDEGDAEEEAQGSDDDEESDGEEEKSSSPGEEGSDEDESEEE